MIVSSLFYNWLFIYFYAFNTQVAQRLLALFNQLHNNDEVRVVIITSSTNEAFCSGADLKERKGTTDEEWKQQHKLFEDMFQALAELKQPTIATVNGFVLAGGFELALNCDCIVAGKGATFGLPEVTRGIMPGCVAQGFCQSAYRFTLQKNGYLPAG